METLSLQEILLKVLRMDSKYCSEDGILLKNKIIEDAHNIKPELLSLLLSDPFLKKHFFSEVGETMIFDKVKFQRFVSNKSFLPDSFTAFKNKIGLTAADGQDFISDSGEVVLTWPYKDCILEGSQTKEDEKRDELFFNEILAPDEINRLTEPKVLTNFRLYDEEGEHKVTNLNNQNLIIKGNNLLVLHSLLEKFRNKIGLIYLDPPYYFRKNKPSDSFSYNSNFKLSTWLTFMKNRLSVAYEMLKYGGVMLVHIKEDGFHWLKVLMEEIFNADNFVDTFIWKNTDNPDSLSKKTRSSVEYIICFEKSKSDSRTYVGKETENGDAPLLNSGNGVHELKFPAGSIHFNLADGHYEISKPDRVEILTPIDVKNSRNIAEVVLKGEFKWGQAMLDQEIAKGTYFIVKSNKFSVRFQRPEGTTMAPEKYFDEQYLSKAIGVGTNEDASTHLRKMGINFSFSKPESVVAFFIKAVTTENDWVMDFFIGSGTTAAVAIKMHRHFIGVDQMDYIETETINRLKKVIDGEQGGISQAVNWQGGGSFVYCELAKANAKFADEIQCADSVETLNDIWERMKESSFISYKIKPSSIDIEGEDYTALSFDDKKRFLLACLDKNMLYVPLSDIDSEDYGISEDDKHLNHLFYNK